jgi:hypothetical protein
MRVDSERWQRPCRKQLCMPEKKTLQRARTAARRGKRPSTQAGAFVKEEMEHIRKGKHGARSSKQAIAIGLSKARRAGVKLKPPKAGQASSTTRKRAASDLRKSAGKKTTKPSAKRSRATTQALKKEGRSAASHRSLSKQAKSAAARRKTGVARRKTASGGRKRTARSAR